MRIWARGRFVQTISRFTGRSRHKRRLSSPAPLTPPAGVDRNSLLLGTAISSTLLVLALIPVAPARAAECLQPPGGPIAIAVAEPITCENEFDITNPAGDAIQLSTPVPAPMSISITAAI